MDFGKFEPGALPLPLHAGSILPDELIDRITGVTRFQAANIPFVRPGDGHDGWPILRWKRDKSGNDGSWIIEDSLTDEEMDKVHR